MAVAFWFCSLLLIAVGCSGEVPRYLITFPRSIKAGANERFCLSFEETPETTGQYMGFEMNLRNVNTNHTFTYTLHGLSTDSSTCSEFTAPAAVSKYALSLVLTPAVGEEIVHNSEVDVRTVDPLTLIQTDKPMYKPGQTVKFRILTLLPNLVARVGEISLVSIKNPSDVRVQQWKNVNGTQGLVSFEMTLSDEPPLGLWTITAMIDEVETTQTFKVEEYVLPKYEVSITPPPFLLVNAEEIEGKVCAKYTYGKPVQGTVSMKVCVKPQYYYYRNEERPCVQFVDEIDGCYYFSVNASKLHLNWSRYSAWGNDLVIVAAVEEAGTGIEINASSTGPQVEFQPLNLKMEDDTNGYYKPGFPYTGRVIVTNPDGSPAPGKLIEVTTNSWNFNSLRVGQNFTTDENGIVEYSISNLTTEMDHIGLRSRAYEYVEPPYRYNNPYHTLRTPRGYHSIRQWYSRSRSYIHIDAPKGKVAVGSDLELDVYYTTPEATYYKFYFIVKSRGQTVFSGHHKHHFKRHDTPLFDTTSDMELLPLPEPKIPPVPVQPSMPPFENVTESDHGGDETEEEEEEEMKPVVEEIIVPEIASSLGVRRRRETGDDGLEGGMENSEEENENMEEGEEEIEAIEEEMGENEEEAEIDVEVPIVMSDHISKLTLSIPITSDMMHKSRILVYYVREDGETVATSLEVEVEERFENEVFMDFVEDTVRPGKPATLEIRADAGSLCSIGVVDKSINLLGGSNQLTPKKVFEKLQNMDHEPYYYYGMEDREYCQKKLEKEGKDQRDDEPYSYWYYRPEGVDAVQAFRDMGYHVFTNQEVQTRKCMMERPMVMYSRGGGMPGPSGSQPVEMQASRGEAGAPSTLDTADSATEIKEETVDLRSYFPETWLWDLEVIGDTGELTLTKDIPHTITEWLGNSICTNPQSGIGLSAITSIRAFQPFFLMFNLPYSAIRGETIPIIITVFNYLPECLVMNVTLAKSEQFSLSTKDENSHKVICVCGEKSETVKFYIAPLELGEIDVSATATSLPDNGICSNAVSKDGIDVTDSVMRQIVIEAEGVEQEYTVSDYVCSEGEEVSRTFSLNLEDSVSEPLVPGSERGFINVIGDIMGPALDNLDNLVRMPYGCGEQNMASFSPNIFVLQYLTNTHQVTEKIEADARRFMRAGYQRQLNYRHNDGSYSAFGGEGSGSTWLSAFVIKCLGQSRQYINIDEEDLSKTYTFFRRNQLETGCFPKIGSVHSKYLKGGMADDGNEVALTAFTVIAFLESGIPGNDPAVERAMNCLNAQDMTDTYTLSLTAYANALYRPGSKTSQALIDSLLAKAHNESQMMHWSRDEEEKPTVPPRWSWWYYRAPSAEVEMTSYALLAMLANEDFNDPMEDTILDQAMPIVLWLTKQRNPWGGFSSTQDTVIALQALAKYATHVYQGDMDVDITVSGTGVNSVFKITGSNSLLLQTTDVAEIPNDIHFGISGVGCALIQANVRYNVERLEAVQPPFDIDVKVYRSSLKPNDCARRTLYICTSYLGEDGKSNMAILNVKMVTGWIPVKSSVKELVEVRSIGITKTEIKKDGVHLYFTALDSIRRCFYFEVEQNLEVSNVKPAQAKVYDYYETDLYRTTTYAVKTTCGTKEELPFLTKEEYETALFDGEIVQLRQPLQGAPGLTEPTCPVCVTEKLEATSQSYKDMVCSYDYVYKSLVGRNGSHPIKVKADLKPAIKRRINKFFKQKMESTCSCSLLDITENGNRALVFTDVDVDSIESEVFEMSDHTKIVAWSSALERAATKSVCR